MPNSQGSIEYLVNYAWAFIIIGVAIAALYAIGAFNSGNSISRAEPGACQVYRPYGAGTIQLIDLQGVCSSEIPKSVAFFNGGSSKVSVPDSGYLDLSNQLTVTAWIYANGSGTDQDAVSKATATTNTGYVFPATTSGWSNIAMDLYIGGSWVSLSENYNGKNSWHYVAATYNGYAMSIYVDGYLAGTVPQSGNIVTNGNNLTIGAGQGNWFAGGISNVQIYNSSLNSNQILHEYIKGIGAPPIDLQHLVGWWPLNSDMVDYSGNGNNGASNTVVFSSAWTKAYSH
ncbi:MAG: LamG domain-containing protein [Candidatus Micrarchaeota archaeon]|nr:LamG domain-containing protein [Candidatus Micrarchaeota archaeon]